MIEKDTLFFDKLGKDYENKFLNLQHVGARLVYQEFMNLMTSNIKYQSNTKILDVGCGTGILLRFLKHNKYQYLFGVDLSSKLIKHAKKESKSINYVIGTVLKPPFKRKFHVVIFYDVLHHVGDIDTCLKNISEILLPDGLLIILDPNKSNIIGEISRKFLKILGLLSLTEKAIRIRELKNKLKNNGFFITKLKYFNVFSFPLSGIIVRYSPLPSSRKLFKKLIDIDKELSETFISEFLGWKILLVAKKVR